MYGLPDIPTTAAYMHLLIKKYIKINLPQELIGNHYTTLYFNSHYCDVFFIIKY